MILFLFLKEYDDLFILVSHLCTSKMLSLFLSSLLVSSSLALMQPLPKDLLRDQGPETKDLLCDICIDVITDLDQWLTSDSTEDQIVEWIEQVEYISIW